MSAAFPCRPARFLQLFFLVSILFLVPSNAAPVTEDLSQTEQGQISEYYGGETKKCYYNFQHYEEGDRIITNEPCLNCTCHKRMLMCYLRVCPFTKAIGQDCKVEKKPDQCCPVITCPEVPVQLLTSSTTEHPTTSSSNAVAHPDNHGCRLENNSFYPDGAQLPIAPNNPCELCYCIRNRTACVMQECTLNVEGCRPVYQDGVCCPVRYDCDYYDVSTTERPSTGGLQLTPTPVPLGCRYGNTMYNDGEKIQTDKPCESCYCMRGDIVCAVRSCGTPLQGKDCEPLPPPEGECCPTTYKCANGTVPIESLSQETATASTYTLHTDESTDHPEQQPAADNIVHDIPEHDEEVVEDHKVPTPSEPETESSTSITSDSEKPTDQTAETAQHEEQVQQLEEESLTPSYDEKPSEEPEKGHIEQIHGEESTGEPEEEDSHLSTSSPIISEHIPSDIVSGIVSIPHVSESAHTDIKIEDTLIPTAIPEYSGIEESIKNNTIQSIITDLLHPEEQKPINVNDLVTSSPETTVLQTGEKQGETENKPDISEDSEATTALPQEQIFHSPDDTPSSVPIESASSVLKPEDENIIKGQEPEKSEETAAVTSDQDEHLHKPASVESDSVPVHSEESATESEQTVHEHPVQTETDDSVIKADESSPNESPVVPDLATHIESEEGEIKPEEPLHVETTAHPGIPESDETVAVKPEEPSAETPAAPVEEHLVETSAAPAEEPSIETQTAEEPSVETQTAEEPSVETQTAEVSVDETKLEEHLHEETPVVPEHPPAVTEVVETGGKPEELPVETSLPPEHVESTESDEVANKPEEPSTIDHSVAPEQPVTEGLEEISTSEYSSSVSSSVETDQVHAESDQVAINPEESSSEIPQQPAQHESESTAQPEAQDATEKPEISETVESETIETKPEEHTTTSLPEQPATIESDHPEQFPEKTSHDETEHPPSSDSNEVASKPEEVVPFVGIPAIPELPSTIVADEVESNQEEHIETTSFPEQQAPIESETESTAIPEHPSSVSSDDLSVKPEETPSATEESSNIESGDGTVKPVELPEETPTLDITEQPIIAGSDESAQKPEEPQIVHAETTDAIPQEPSAVESDDVAAKPEESSLKPHEDTATESVDIPETSEISKPQEVEESSRPESKPEENIIALDNEALEVSSDAHLHPTESSQGEGITESEQTIQPSKPEEEINRIPEDAVKPEDNKVEDSTEHETTVLHEHVQLPAVSDETESEHEITDATEKPAAEEVVPGKLDNTVDAVEEEHHTSSDIQHQTSATDSENAVATELSEGEKPVEAKPQDEGNAVENVTEIKPEAPESNVIHDSEQNAISETNTVVPVENEQPSESDGATTSKSDISESSVDESQKPDTTKESLESYNSEESSVPLESDTGNVESSTLYATVDESPVHSSESQEQPTIPEDAQEPEKNVSEGEDTNQIPEQSFDSQSTNQEDTTTDKDQTSISHVSEDIDKPEKTEVPIPAIYEEPPKPSESESDQGELQTHVESNTADVPIEGENKKPEKHDSETATPESDVSSKPEESTSIDILPEEVKPVETSDSSQHEPSIDSENQVNGEKPVAPEIIPPSSESVNELITGEVAPSPNEIPDTIIPVHGGAIDIESITQHLPGPTGILSPESEQGVIPGEGSCLVDDVTYSNNSKIPSSSQCHKECVCISSIVHCIGIDCPPPPPHLSNCMPIQQGPDSCCPMYACDGETPTLLESHSQIGDSDGSKQPVKGSDSVQQHETPESPEKPVEIQTVESTHDESSITIHGDVVPDHVESDSASSQSVHKPETSEVIPEKPAETPEHPSLPALPIPENVEHDFIPEQPSEHEGTDITDDQIISEILPQEHTEIHDSVGEHEIPVEQQTSTPSDDTKGSDKVPETSEHVTESSTTDEKIPETPVTSSVHSVPSEETVTAIIVEEPISTDETAVESKPSEAPEDSLTPTESEVPASPEQPILDTSLDHEESKPVQGGGEAESPLQPQETPSNVLPSQDVVEASGSSEQPEQSAVTDSVIQHEIVLEDASTPIPLQEGQQQVTAVSGDIQPPLAVDKPSSVKFESADSELTRPEDSSEPVKSDQESSTIIEAVEPTQQSIVESEQPSVSHKDEVSEAPQEVTEDVHPSTDSSKLSEDVTTSVTKDEVPEHLVDSHASVTDANKIDTSGEAVHEDVTAAQKPEESETLVTQAPVDLDLSKLEETSPESVGQEATATATQAHSEQPSVSHDATPEDADHAQSVSEEFTTSEGDALVTSGPLEDVQHLVTSSPFKPEEAPINADKPEQEVISEQMGKPSEQHAETEEGTPSTVGAQHNEEPVYEEVTTETNAHTEAEGEVPASLPGSTEGQSNLPEQDGTVQQQTEEQSHQPTPEKPAPVDSDVPEETTVQLEDHELVSPSKTDIPVESHIHDEIPKPSESITPDEAQKPQGETNKDKETEKPVDLSETPVHTEQAQVITSDEQASSVEHKPEEPTVTSPVEQIPEEPHVTGVDQTPPDVELKPEEPQITSDEHEPPKVGTESKPEEPHITSDEHEPPKVDTESKPEEPQITSGEHEPPKGDIELKPEEPQVTSDEHEPPKGDIELKPEEPQVTSDEHEPPKEDAELKPEEPQITSGEHEPPKGDVELKPEEPQITSSEHEPPKVVELKPEEPQITSDEHEPPKSDVELKPEGPQITTDEQAPLKPEEPHITSGEQVPTKVDTESKPEEPQISSDKQTPTKVETELKPEEQHITGDEHVQAEVKPEEPHVTSDEQAPPKVDTELKPEEPQVTSDEQKPSVIDHEGPQVIGESGEPLGVKPEESHQPEEPHITSDTTSLEQKPEPHITTNIETQPEANIEQKPSSLVPSTHITQDILESQQHVTVAPDSVNELHSEHQTLTKPIEHIPGLYPEEESNYGPLQVPGWTPKPYQPSEHPDEINQHEEHFPSGGDMDYELEEDGPFGPGTCRYGGKIYVSAQQIPRDDPCDFCFCFRSDIICLQQSCPPPIHRCRQESIKGFCCPRYECPVSMATALNLTTTTTTTTTTLPPHFFAHAYKGAARRTGCQVRGKAYRVGEEIRSTSGPCLQCICGADGQMKCEPKVCSPEPMLRKMMEEAISRRRR